FGGWRLSKIRQGTCLVCGEGGRKTPPPGVVSTGQGLDTATERPAAMPNPRFITTPRHSQAGAQPWGTEMITYWLIDAAAIGLAGLLAALLTAIVSNECSAFFLRRGDEMLPHFLHRCRRRSRLRLRGRPLIPGGRSDMIKDHAEVLQIIAEQLHEIASLR